MGDHRGVRTFCDYAGSTAMYRGHRCIVEDMERESGDEAARLISVVVMCWTMMLSAKM